MDPSELFSGVENDEQQRNDVVVTVDRAARPGADVGPTGEAGVDVDVGENPVHQDPVDFVILSQLLIRHLDNILVCSL